MREIIKELETNMSTREKLSFRKRGHPQNDEQPQQWERTETSDTLNVFDNSESRTPTLVIENHPQDSRVKIKEDGIFQTLDARMGMGGGNVPMVLEISNEPTVIQRRFSSVNIYENGVSPTLEAGAGEGGNNMPMVMASKEPTLLESNQNHATIRTDGISTTLSASMGMGGGYVPMVTEKEQVNTIVRRLTPLECERLQNFPDGWTDIGDWTDSKGKVHKGEADSPRYKALGNSIALPFWQWMATRMVAVLAEEGTDNPTMASLFDGIGGFPLVFSRCGCKPIWNSEIEEFPEAVTSVHFGNEDLGIEGDYQNYI